MQKSQYRFFKIIFRVYDKRKKLQPGQKIEKSAGLEMGTENGGQIRDENKSMGTQGC